MLNEGYSGICPNCGYDRMFVRYGSSGYAHHDICPNCCFGLEEIEERREDGGWDPVYYRDMEAVEDQIRYLKENIEKMDNPLDHIGLLLLTESWSDDNDTKKNVFAYDNYDWREHERLAMMRHDENEQTQ